MRNVHILDTFSERGLESDVRSDQDAFREYQYVYRTAAASVIFFYICLPETVVHCMIDFTEQTFHNQLFWCRWRNAS